MASISLGFSQASTSEYLPGMTSVGTTDSRSWMDDATNRTCVSSAFWMIHCHQLRASGPTGLRAVTIWCFQLINRVGLVASSPISNFGGPFGRYTEINFDQCKTITSVIPTEHKKCCVLICDRTILHPKLRAGNPEGLRWRCAGQLLSSLRDPNCTRIFWPRFYYRSKGPDGTAEGLSLCSL